MKHTMTIRRLLVAALALVLALPVCAQYTRDDDSRSRDRDSRHERHDSRGRHGDAVSVSMRNAGALENELSASDFESVRLLRIDGPLNNDDFKFIRKIANRSKCKDSRGKSVDNYLELDLKYATISGRLSSGILQNCSHLRSVTLPNRMHKVVNDALSGCGELEEVYMSHGVEEIGARAFENCRRLTYIELPEGLEVMGDECLRSCSKLTSLRLPSSLREIGKRAFEDTGIRTLSLPAGTGIVGNHLGKMTSLTTIEV